MYECIEGGGFKVSQNRQSQSPAFLNERFTVRNIKLLNRHSSTLSCSSAVVTAVLKQWPKCDWDSFVISSAEETVQTERRHKLEDYNVR